MNKKIIAVIALVAVLCAAFAINFFRTRGYTVIHPEKSDINEAIYGLGKIKSKNRFEVIAGVISTVTKRYVNEGDFVVKGTPLIQLNEHALFRAPFTGTVTYANYFEGETVVPNVPILRVEDLEQKYIELSLEQQSVLRLKIDQPAKVSFESLRGTTLTGKVTAIFPRKDEFIVSISVENLEKNILPGMTADVTIEVGSIKNAMTLPLAAIKNGTITIKRDDRWQTIKVEIGQIDSLSAEIKNPPLSETDSVRIKTGG